MRKYFIKGFYFCIPFLIIFIFIFFVDPYEFINVSHFINSDDKIDVYKRSDESSPRGTMLWKVLHYRRKPVANVLIGDSQGTNIDEDLIKAESGKDVFNFCIPGSSYNTMFETFWFVNDQCKLENVYMQLGFMNYNAKRPYSLFHFAQDYIDNPFLYFTTKEILFDSLKKITPNNVQGEFYLTDIIEISYKERKIIGAVIEKNFEEFFGVK